MTDLLALETSGELCSVCLVVDGNRFTRTEHVGRRHNESLLPMLDDVCRSAGLDALALSRRLDAVAFGCGPGSFTGVRIAAAAAQGIAVAAMAPIVPVVSSRALALAAAAHPDLARAAGIVTLIRSRKSLYYVATYRLEDGIPVPCNTDSLCEERPPEAFFREHRGWCAAGAVPEWWPAECAPVLDVRARADDVCRLAMLALERDGGVDAAAGLPLYVLGDSPWREAPSAKRGEAPSAKRGEAPSVKRGEAPQ